MKFIGFAVIVVLAFCEGRSTEAAAAKKTCAVTTPRQNKALALKAYNELFNEHRFDRLEQYYAADYIQHNPGIADGIVGLRAALVNSTFLPTLKQQQFIRTAAEGDLVFVHARSIMKDSKALNIAVVDIFRVECGLIKEHWDVVQMANTTGAANAHPFF